MSAPLSLVLGRHPIGRALTDAVAARHDLSFRREDVRPIHAAFAPMIRSTRYDVCELAIVSAMQAVAYGKPLVLLPVTVAARFQHRCLVCNRARERLTPATLPGRRIGVRAYTQTTGAWVRAILQAEYGLHPGAMQWVTQQDAHVAEYADPPQVARVSPESSLEAMLAAGEIDAAIFGNDMPEAAWIAPVIADPDAAARASFEASGVVPINHLVAVTRAVAEAEPARLRRLFAAFLEAKAQLAAAELSPDLYPMGVAAMRPSVERLLGSAYDQGLVDRPLSVEALFAGALEVLGADAA